MRLRLSDQAPHRSRSLRWLAVVQTKSSQLINCPTLSHAEDFHSFVDLALESIGRLNQVQNFSLIHLQEHSGDLSSVLMLQLIDKRIELLSQHLHMDKKDLDSLTSYLTISTKTRWKEARKERNVQVPRVAAPVELKREPMPER
eukprot:SM000027S09581  [mRNA]  locus=s27:182075:182656:+ [translate_table: standard]